MNQIDRRSVLQAGGALVVSFGLPLSSSTAKPVSGPKTVSPDRVDGFLAITRDGRITVYSGKVDLGTGVRTALIQIVAEELDVPMSHVSLVEGDTALTPDQGVTSGSLSIQNGGMQLRRAAATARRAVLRRAAARLRRDISTLSLHEGVITAGDGRRLPIGEVVDGTTLALDVAKDVREKSPHAYTIVGKAVPRLDIPDKVNGRFTFMQDFKLPDMLHGRVVRPSGFGATLVSCDESSVADIPGIVKVVRINNFLGVVAKSEWSAIRAAQQFGSDLVQVGGVAGSKQNMAARAQHPGRPRRCHQPHCRFSFCARKHTKQACCNLRIRHPYPWLHRPLLRRGNVRRR